MHFQHCKENSSHKHKDQNNSNLLIRFFSLNLFLLSVWKWTLTQYDKGRKYFVLFLLKGKKKSTLIWILNHPEYLAEDMFLLFAFLGLACYAFGISTDITHSIFSFHILIFNIL